VIAAYPAYTYITDPAALRLLWPAALAQPIDNSSAHVIRIASRREPIKHAIETQLTRQAINYIVRVAGRKAKLGRVWPHMLRHSCGYYLADQGTDPRTIQDYLGHRDPKHTAHYTRVAGHRFEGLWR
jgi:integrase